MEMTLMSAIKTNLLLPGESLKIDEYKKLTDKDKDDLRTWFADMGITIVAPK